MARAGDDNLEFIDINYLTKKQYNEIKEKRKAKGFSVKQWFDETMVNTVFAK